MGLGKSVAQFFRGEWLKLSAGFLRSAFVDFEESVGDLRGVARDGDSGVFHGGKFGFGGSRTAGGDDGSGMAHSTAFGCSGSGDKSGDGFLHVLFDVGAGFFFCTATDLADHDDGVGIGVFVEHANGVGLGGAVDGVSANTNTGRLAVASAGELPDGFVSEGSGAGDDADAAGFVDVSGHDTDFALPGGDDAGAVRADESCLVALVEALADFGHICDGNSFGDADDEGDFGFDGFEDGVGGEGGWYVDDGYVGTVLLYGFGDGVANGYAVFPGLPAFAGGDSGDDVGAIVDALACVEGAGFTGDALYEKSCVLVDEDAHG